MNLLQIKQDLRLVSMTLVGRVGLYGAFMLHQMYYHMEHIGHPKEDGRRWFYKTNSDWAAEMPFSLRSVRRAIKDLEDRGVVLSTDAHNKRSKDATKWYTVVLEHELLALPVAEAPWPQGTAPLASEATPPGPTGQSVTIDPHSPDPQEIPCGPCGPAETAAEDTGEQSSEPDEHATGEGPAEEEPAWEPKDGAKTKPEGAVQTSTTEVLADFPQEQEVAWSAKAFTDKRPRKDLKAKNSGHYVESFWRDGMVHLHKGAHGLSLPLTIKQRGMLLYVARRLYDPETEKPRHALGRLETILREWGGFAAWLDKWGGVKGAPKHPEIKFIAGADMATKICLYCNMREVAEAKKAKKGGGLDTTSEAKDIFGGE